MVSKTTYAQAPTKVRHVRGMLDIQANLHGIITTARRMKAMAKLGPLPQTLAGKVVLMLFEKNSTRTRVSFEAGIARLGGIPVVLDALTTQMGRGESVEDTAKTLSRYGDVLVYRAKSQATLDELAYHADIPVVNALTDEEHPCQILADWMTLEEKWGTLQGRTFAYVGDGNNMTQSYLLGAPMAGMDIHVATPAGYAPDWKVMEKAEALAHLAGTDILLTEDPKEAVNGADAVATDTWISMGDEKEEAMRLNHFQGFTVDEAMMALAEPGAKFVHCLPGHWGHEATHEVAHGPQSIIFDQAENRMWVQMALLVHLLGLRFT